MKNKVISLLLALLASVSMFTACSNQDGGDAVNVSVEEYGEHDVSKYVSTSGTVENGNSNPYVVSTNIESYCVKKLNVQVGDYVKAGDVICEFDTADIKKQIADAESKISSSDAIDEKTIAGLKKQLEGQEQVQKLKLDQLNENKQANQQKYNEAEQKYNTAQSNYNIALSSYNDAETNLKNAVSAEDISYYSGLCASYQSQISQYSTEMEQWNSVMSAASEELNNFDYEYSILKLETDKEINDLKFQIESYKSENETRENLKALKEVLKNSIVYAEYDGIVSEVNIKEGQVCTNKNLLSIIDDNNKIIHVRLNDNDMLTVKEGMEVEINTSSDLVESMSGEVCKINRVKGEDGFDVYIKCSELDNVNIGMSVSNNILVFDETVTSVAKNAVRKKDGEEGNYVLVAVPQSSGTYVLEERSIITGVESDEYIQVVSGDLNSGDKVVVTDIASLKEGMNVAVVEKE